MTIRDENTEFQSMITEFPGIKLMERECQVVTKDISKLTLHRIGEGR
jgi:hypothetical protein